MNTQVDKTQKNKNQSVSYAVPQKQSGGDFTFQFVDNRPVAIAQRKLQEMAHNSPQVRQAAQLQAMADNYTAGQQQPIQKKENNPGISSVAPVQLYGKKNKGLSLPKLTGKTPRKKLTKNRIRFGKKKQSYTLHREEEDWKQMSIESSIDHQTASMDFSDQDMAINNLPRHRLYEEEAYEEEQDSSSAFDPNEDYGELYESLEYEKPKAPSNRSGFTQADREFHADRQTADGMTMNVYRTKKIKLRRKNKKKGGTVRVENREDKPRASHKQPDIEHVLDWTTLLEPELIKQGAKARLNPNQIRELRTYGERHTRNTGIIDKATHKTMRTHKKGKISKVSQYQKRKLQRQTKRLAKRILGEFLGNKQPKNNYQYNAPPFKRVATPSGKQALGFLGGSMDSSDSLENSSN